MRTLRFISLFVLTLVFGTSLAREKASVKGLNVVPDVESGTVLVQLHAFSDHERKANFRVSCGGQQKVERVFLSEGDNVLNTRLQMGAKATLWSEWNPSLNFLKASLDGIGTKEIEFGMREFTMDNDRVLINGIPTMLLGINDSDMEAYKDSLSTLDQWTDAMYWMRECGLNFWHFRNSIPEETVFQAADEAGVYVLVDDADDDYFQQYGSHPSYMNVQPRLWKEKRKSGKVIDKQGTDKKNVLASLATSGCDALADLLFSDEEDKLQLPKLWTSLTSGVTPLLFTEKSEWYRGEVVEAEVAIANFSPSDLTENIEITLEGETLSFDYSFSEVTSKHGELSELLFFKIPLVTVLQPCNLTMKLKYGKYTNSYLIPVR